MSAESVRMVLKTGREKSLLRRHPWIYSGAVKEVAGSPENGAVLPVYSANEQFICQAAYSHKSQIVGRVWTYLQEEIVDETFLRNRLSEAILRRSQLGIHKDSDAVRLVHAESDQLPGLVVDRYGEVLVVQFLSSGVEVWREQIGEILQELTGVQAVYERSDAEVRTLEGLEERSGLLTGGEITDPVKIGEHGLKYLVPIASGHKTGFYLDQRDNRLLIRDFVLDKDVLDCFSYSGGFTLNALAGGAMSVTAVDNSAPALELLEQNVSINAFEKSLVTAVQADVFHQLRKFRDEGRDFDVIVLDPPKFAPTRAHAQKASRGYKDINLLAFKLLRPGGILFTFSCSGGIDAGLFWKIVAGASLDAQVNAQAIVRMSQAPDHPVALNFPEGEYLKGLVCRME